MQEFTIVTSAQASKVEELNGIHGKVKAGYISIHVLIHDTVLWAVEVNEPGKWLYVVDF